jgi:hypothetical protein
LILDRLVSRSETIGCRHCPAPDGTNRAINGSFGMQRDPRPIISGIFAPGKLQQDGRVDTGPGISDSRGLWNNEELRGGSQDS